MRIKYQIFLTLLAASALLILIMYAISRWSFNRGFVDYVNQNEISRLSPIAERLIYEYEQHGDWDWVDETDLRQFRANRDKRGPSSRSGREQTRAGAARPERVSPDKTNHDRSYSTDALSGNRPLPITQQSGASTRPPGRSSGRRSGPALVLVDENKKTLVGKIRSNATMHWVELKSEATIVAYLGFPKNQRVDRHFDQVFADKQMKSFGWTALAMIVLSALLSIPFADRIVRPLLKVNKAVDEISGGNYAHRLETRRRDELGDLASNINTLGVTLEKNRNARQRWIAEISHELRTPLAVMRGEIEAVQDGVRVVDKLAVNSLHNEVMNLARLVNDLHTLSLSDVGALNYQMDELDMSEQLGLFFANNESALADHAIDYSLSKPEQAGFYGDEQRLEQLLSNLLQNTCRYTDRGGQLHVALERSTINEREYLEIDWLDSSPGVDESALPHLFDPLFRAESSRNREFGGSGLGLSIAKRIVEAHGGTISAHSSSLGGLRINIRFPVSRRNL